MKPLVNQKYLGTSRIAKTSLINIILKYMGAVVVIGAGVTACSEDKNNPISSSRSQHRLITYQQRRVSRGASHRKGNTSYCKHANLIDEKYVK